MKAAAYDLATPADLAGALAALGGEARPVTGAQSLGPMLNLRLARPAALVDLARVPELRTADDAGDHVRYGAAVTHAEIEDGEVPDATPGWMARIARGIAYRAVRNRGTVGGSLAHADPAADWLVTLTALGGSVVLSGAGGERTVPLDGFATAPFTTVLEPGEIISAVIVPKPRPGARWGYFKAQRKAGDFAKASAALLVDGEAGVTRLVVGAIERPPLVVPDPASLLEGRVTPADALAALLPDREPLSLRLHAAAIARAIAAATHTAASAEPSPAR
ncbi:carbon monoxide dehydrogenase [Acuticoccus sediminis]|uniref:Carbon monoxide dehydrogenase n=1 Tax=Acuticoccus sediminis TaxID=2184697 RepID=A0A8B2NXW7_9HYPH|nr:FAD binding domain-containing protein [Acuticoccus sediminis]RAI03540.1 carbon monoxide dehydrogenase [Acuticoccus sediminis]